MKKQFTDKYLQTICLKEYCFKSIKNINTNKKKIKTRNETKKIEIGYKNLTDIRRTLLRDNINVFNMSNSNIEHENYGYYNIYDKRTGKNYLTSNYNKDIESDVYNIPYISHRFWIVNSKIKLPNNLQLITSLNSINKVNKKNSKLHWIHLLWTNKVKTINKYIINNGYKEIIRFLLVTSPYYGIYSKFQVICKKTEIIASISVCSDLLKHSVLEKYGGLYIDLDYKIENYHEELHKIFEFYVPTSYDGWLGNAIMSSAPDHWYHVYARQIISNAIISTKTIYNENEIEKTHYFNRSDINYVKYNNDFFELFMTPDSHVPFDVIYASSLFTTIECNTNIVCNNEKISLCTIGTDLQTGSWYSLEIDIPEEYINHSSFNDMIDFILYT